MPVIRVEKCRDYTVMSNVHLRDKELSLKAKGLLSLILSLPDDWNYSINGLASINKESRDSIRTAINELESRGYIKRHRLRTAQGLLGDMEYVVYEKPVTEIPASEEPVLENPTQDNPALENASQLNTELPITDLQKKKCSKDARRIYGTYKNVRLNDEELQKLQTAYPSDYLQKIERLSEYIESSGRTYKNHYLTICQWAQKDAEKDIGKTKFENYACKEGESY